MRLGDVDLALNPGAKVTVFANTAPPIFRIEAPLRGNTLATCLIHEQDAPAAHAFLVSALIDGSPAPRLDPEALASLHSHGLFVTPDNIPADVRYGLDVRTAPPNPNGMTDLAPSEPWPWLDKTGLVVPKSWQTADLDFAPYAPGALWIPCRHDGAAHAAAPTTAQFDTTDRIDEFAREGYTSLPGLLPETQVHALGRYFRELASEGFLERHADQSILRHIAHDHPVTRFWHEQLNDRVSRLVGRKTKPSYSFVSYYLEGGDLFWHTDRDPCEYTITLLVDYDPLDADGRSAWALHLKDRQGRQRSIFQRLGDALIFKGRELPHGRDRKPDGHRSGSILFHYVDDTYEGSLS